METKTIKKRVSAFFKMKKRKTMTSATAVAEVSTKNIPTTKVALSMEGAKRNVAAATAVAEVSLFVPKDIWKLILMLPRQRLVVLSRISQTCKMLRVVFAELGPVLLAKAEALRACGQMQNALMNLYRAALAKNTRAMLHLGWISFYGYGWGVGGSDEETNRFREWFRKGYEINGSLSCGVMYAYTDFLNKLSRRYVQKITRAVKNSKNTDPFARAWAYYVGLGYSARNSQKAFEWFRKIADEGDEYAQVAIGECYRFGKMRDKDAELAWYGKAAESGNAAAQTRLAFIYRNARNFDQSRLWKQKTQQQGCPLIKFLVT